MERHHFRQDEMPLPLEIVSKENLEEKLQAERSKLETLLTYNIPDIARRHFEEAIIEINQELERLSGEP